MKLLKLKMNGKMENYYVIYVENIKTLMNFKSTNIMNIDNIEKKDVENANNYKTNTLDLNITMLKNYIKYYKNVGLLLKIDLKLKIYPLLFLKKI